MATRTFVGDGASHNWSSTGAWVEAAVPTAADDVVFSSNTAGSILVIDGTSASPSLCRSLNTTNYTRTITFGTSKQLNIGDSGGGSLTLTAGMTFVPTVSSLINFVSTTTGNTITHAGYVFGPMTYNGAGGAWTWQDNNSMATGGTLTLTAGTLTTNNKNTANGIILSSNNSNTRSLVMGTTNFTLANSVATVWDIGTSTGMTLSASSSTITWATSTTTSTFAGGGLTYGTLTNTANRAAQTITGANTFGTLTLSWPAITSPATTIGYFLSANQTVTGTFTAAGGSAALTNFIASDTVGTPRTISAGTATVTLTDLRDITGAGSASWNFSGLTSTANGDCGGNSGITFTTPKNCYLKTGTSVGFSGANWYTTSGGSTLISPTVPLPQDTCIIDANSITAGSVTLTRDEPRTCGMNFTGVTNTPTFALGSTAVELYGSLTLVSGMTHTGTAPLTFMGRSSYTLDGGTLTWPTSSTISLNAPGGTLTLARNITSNAGLVVTSGTLALASFNPTVTAISVTGGVISGTGAISGTTYSQSGGVVTLGGTLTLTGAAVLSGGTLDMNGYNETGATTLAVSGTGTLNLSSQFKCSSTITVSGGTVANTGSSSELKTTGNSAITFSGGTSTCMKVTEGGTANVVVSGTGSLTIPLGGVVSWTSGIFEVSGASALFSTGGTVTVTASTLSVTSSSSGGSFTFG